MGVNAIYLDYLEDRGAFKPKETKVLDIGAQNLYLGEAEKLQRFIHKYNPDMADEACADLSRRLAEGGVFLPEHNGFKNDAFFGDLLIAAGMTYVSLDLFERDNNIACDLNFYKCPPELAEHFDLVLNFGTTEHIINQYNCLKVIHDATAVDGLMFHQVPSTGCIDHGYFLYCPQLFHELAEANGYDLIDLWFSGPYGGNTIFATLRHAVELEKMRDVTRPHNNVAGWDQAMIPDAVVNVLLRKTASGPFKASLEISTAISKPADTLQNAEEPDDPPMSEGPEEPREEPREDPGEDPEAGPDGETLDEPSPEPLPMADPRLIAETRTIDLAREISRRLRTRIGL